MADSLLLVDIGNTCIKLMLSRPGAQGTVCSLPTKAVYTVDSLGLSLCQLFAVHGVDVSQLSACVFCSVVPDVAALFRLTCERYLHLAPLSFPEDFSIDMVNGYERPQEVGADRLLAAFAARRLFPAPRSLISVDFGTATTFDCVTDNVYLGGLICPGLFSSRDALASATAKLPRISLAGVEQEVSIGKNTATSMAQGFFFGFAAMTEGLCERLRRQMPGPVFVIGTGGIAGELSGICRAFDAVRPDLILEGLKLLWDERSRRS